MSAILPDKRDSLTQFAERFGLGMGFTIPAAPFVNGFNRMSVVACTHNCSSLRAYQLIFRGTIEQQQQSLRHFTVGMAPFFVKESARVAAKAACFGILKPYLERYYTHMQDPMGKLKTSLIFSFILAGFEMGINPLDTCCTIWQNGNSIQNVFRGRSLFAIVRHLYNGALANGIRQFGQSLGYSYSEDICNHWLKTYSQIDPHDTYGILVKSFPQALFFTTYVYPFHRFKTEIQYQPFLADKAKVEKRWIVTVVFEKIIQTQTPFGLLRGFWAKTLSNSILMFGASMLLEQGRKAANHP